MSPASPVVAGTAVLAAAGAFLLLTALPRRPPVAEPPNVETQATRACEAFVRDRLPVPGSARFGSVVTTPAAGSWSVVGTVSAADPAGEPVRDFFACRTHTDARGSWVDEQTRLSGGTTYG